MVLQDLVHGVPISVHTNSIEDRIVLVRLQSAQKRRYQSIMMGSRGTDQPKESVSKEKEDKKLGEERYFTDFSFLFFFFWPFPSLSVFVSLAGRRLGKCFSPPPTSVIRT